MTDVLFDDDLRTFRKHYTQYYNGDLSFTGFVLEQIYDDITSDVWNDFNYKFIIKLLIALLLRKEKLGL